MYYYIPVGSILIYTPWWCINIYLSLVYLVVYYLLYSLLCCILTGLVLIFIAWFLSSLWLVPILGWHHIFNDGLRTVAPNTCETEYAMNTTLKVMHYSCIIIDTVYVIT